MGAIEEAEKKFEDWLIQKELPIALRAAASALVGFLASGKAAVVLAHLGITIDPDKLMATIVKFGTLLAVAGFTHLTSSWVTHKVSNPPPPPPAGPSLPPPA